jgi:hypothetical protein
LAPQAIAIVLDFIALEAGNGDDDQLAARGLLERFEPPGELGLLRGRKQIRLIDDAAAERGKGLGKCG